MSAEFGVTVGDSLERLDATIDGFDFAEVSIGDGTALADLEREPLQESLSAADADLCVHLPYKQVVGTPSPEINAGIVAYMTRLLELAGDCGATKAVLHGTLRDPHDTDLRPVFAEQLAAIAAAGDDVGVELVVENVGHQARGLPLSVLGDLARETDTAVCFDVGHAYMEEGNDGIDRFLSGWGELVSHLHVHDVRSRGDTHMPIGAGEIDYDIVADHLEGFDGTVAVEVFTDDLGMLRDSDRRIRDVLEPRS